MNATPQARFRDESLRPIESVMPMDPGNPASPAFDLAFDQCFGLLALAMNRHFVHYMVKASRELCIDFESLLVWGLLSQINVAHLAPPGSSPQRVLDENGRLRTAQTAAKPARLRDLAQISGLPRETVRRKLRALEQRGFVARREDGWIHRSDTVESVMRDFNRDTLKQLLTVSSDLRQLLRDGYRQQRKDMGGVMFDDHPAGA